MKVAFISGTSIHRSNLFDDWAAETVATRYGSVVLRTRENLATLNRHGSHDPLPPHSINFRANVAALQQWGAAEAVSLNSVGSLRTELAPGAVVSCSDYVSFAPATFHDDSLVSFAPEVPNRLIPRLLAGLDFEVVLNQVYVQTRGPRFETKAEIQVLKTWGDVVGMTMASEADLCQEAQIGYNSLCMVDNHAHGLTGQPLSQAEFERLVSANQRKVNRLVAHVLARLSD